MVFFSLLYFYCGLISYVSIVVRIAEEESVDRKYALRVSQEFALQTATGKTFITGSGDWGVGQQGKFSCDKFEADFPSSSPYVVSTGATLFTTQHPEFTKQAAVSFSSGGFSNYFPRPAFQDDAVKSFLAQTTIDTRFFNQSGRAFPGILFQILYFLFLKKIAI